MGGGYTGKMLVVDLKNQTTVKEQTDLNDAKAFIGAKGLGAKILSSNRSALRFAFWWNLCCRNEKGWLGHYNSKRKV
jgi:hypothetical protein